MVELSGPNRYPLYHVTTDESRVFVMDAPLHIIAAVFKLRPEAERRIEREAPDNLGCLLCCNRGNPFPWFVGDRYRVFLKR